MALFVRPLIRQVLDLSAILDTVPKEHRQHKRGRKVMLIQGT